MSSLSRSWTTLVLSLTVLAGIVLAMLHVVATIAVVSASPEATNTVYLPFAMSRPLSSQPTTTPTVGPGTPQPTPAPTTQPTTTPTTTPVPSGGVNKALFMQPSKKVAGPSIKVDAQGGMHLAYYDAVPLAQHPAATYGYCPPPASQCSDDSKWSYVPLSDQVKYVQLQITADGHPRLLITTDPLTSYSEAFFYAECNANCGSGPDAWTITAVTTRDLSPGGDIGSYYLPKRSFALDPQGHPAFVFYDANYQHAEPDHYGGYYYSCQSACTTASSWTEARFTHQRNYDNSSYFDYELVDTPVLKFTSDGHPRILSNFYPLQNTGTNETSGIYYFACDNGCDSDTNWQRTKIIERESGAYPAWDLALDVQNRPRVTFFRYDASDNTAKTLFYLWCDADCLNNGNWKTLNLNLPKGDGIGADIELDATGHPRIAYLNDTQLGYTWCDGDCTTLDGWFYDYLDNDDQMTTDYPIARPFTCAAGIWDSYSPSLALDNLGNPRVAYDASYKAYCQYQDPTDPTKPVTNSFTEIWHSVRNVLVPQPK